MSAQKNTKATETSTKGPKRDHKGRFVKGGGGRLKGSKNRSTEIREAIESGMVEEMEHMALHVLKKTYELAMNENDTTCLKMLMDRMLPVSKQEKTNKGIDKSKIVINVTTLPEKEDPKEVIGEVIEMKKEA